MGEAVDINFLLYFKTFRGVETFWGSCILLLYRKLNRGTGWSGLLFPPTAFPTPDEGKVSKKDIKDKDGHTLMISPHFLQKAKFFVYLEYSILTPPHITYIALSKLSKLLGEKPYKIYKTSS